MSEPTVAIVTGASQGIGLAIARDLARRGMKVVIADRVNAGVSAALLGNEGLDVRGFEVDVSDAGQVDALMSYTQAEFGAVAFFVGHESAFITGQTLVVDGGSYFH